MMIKENENETKKEIACPHKEQFFFSHLVSLDVILDA